LLAELAEAGSYVQSILPEPLKEGAIRAEWSFQPSAQLGGDAFGYHALPGGSWALYLIDVSGHGVGAALLSVSAVNVLRTASVWEDAQGSPSDVLAELNRVFPMERHNQQFFTAWIGVYDPRRGVLSFSSAGHPPAVLFGAGPDRVELRTNGLPVGALPEAAFRTGEVAVPGGAELFVFSDGVYEIPLAGTATGTLQEFVDHLRQARENPQFRPDEMLAWARARARGGHLDDDFSLMRIRFGVG
jgi:sigma-B regulation protein RsbU (phosphoserine phosphatase)